MLKLAWGVVGVTLTLGCLTCIPVALPPANLGLGGGSSVAGTGPEAGIEAQVGWSPFQFLPGWTDRLFDATAGVRLGHLGGSALFLDGEVHPLRTDWPYGLLDDATLRLGLAVGGEWFWAREEGEWGTRATITLEAVSFLRGVTRQAEPGQRTKLHAYGETGVGIYVQAGYRRLGGEPFLAVTGGLVLTTPAMAGFLMAW